MQRSLHARDCVELQFSKAIFVNDLCTKKLIKIERNCTLCKLHYWVGCTCLKLLT